MKATFSIECVVNGFAKNVNELTKAEARKFRDAAEEMSGWLTDRYKLDRIASKRKKIL